MKLLQAIWSHTIWFFLNYEQNKPIFTFMLGFWQDQFDTIDLSDNEIVKLENFPHLNRLGTLLINNNRITRINPNIGGKIQMVLLSFWHH